MFELNDKIILESSNSKYAYVCLVISNNIYASPAIVLAESIRKTGGLGDLVVIINTQIDVETIELLKKFYDKIHIISDTTFLTTTNNDPVQQVILNKFEALVLDYEKIFLIDVDTIIFNNIDEMFELPHNGVLYANSKINYGFMLIRPSVQLYNTIYKYIKDNMGRISKETKPFEYVTNVFKSAFKLNKLPIELSIGRLEKNDGIQYSGDKPFLMTSNKTIEFRSRLKYFKVWFVYLINILNAYPEIRKYNCLKESIQVCNYFLHDLGRSIVGLNQLKKRDVKKVIEDYYTNSSIVPKTSIYYYHLDISKEYSSKNLICSSNMADIKVFMNFIKNKIMLDNKLKKCTSVRELIINGKTLKNEEYLHLMSYVLKAYPNIFVVIQINRDDRIEDFENNVVYKKIFALKYSVVKNMMFNIFQDLVYRQRITKLNLVDDSVVELCVKIYVSELKLDMYDACSKDVGTNMYYFIIEPDSRLRFSSIFFNTNTLGQHIEGKIKWFDENRFLNKKQLVKLLFFQTLKKWVYNNYTLEELDNIIVYGQNVDKTGIILYDFNDYTHSMEQINKLKDSCVSFIDLIFVMGTGIGTDAGTSTSTHKLNITQLYNPKEFMEYEGIKFFIECTNVL